MLRPLLSLSAISFLLTIPASAQETAANQPAFDIVSIRPHKDGATPDTGPTPNGYRSIDAPLLVAIRNAYIPTGQGEMAYFSEDRILNVPDWLRRDHYDLEARVAEADLKRWHNPAEQGSMLRAMLQAALADQLKLAIHRETKVAPVYELTVNKNGPKFAESKPGTPRPPGMNLPDGGVLVMSAPDHLMHLYGCTIQVLARLLTNMTGRQVVDKTGLTGHYDLAIDRIPIQAPAAPSATGNPPADEGPSIFTALADRLGLRLVSTKTSIETLVIDHIEKPIPN